VQLEVFYDEPNGRMDARWSGGGGIWLFAVIGVAMLVRLVILIGKLSKK
jgi:hypothetical protein